jgi:F-box-like
MDHTLSLPNEILAEILGHIPWPIMPLLAQVCHRWACIGRQLWIKSAPQGPQLAHLRAIIVK